MKIGCEKVWIAAVLRLFLCIATRETRERERDKRDECMIEKKKKMETKKSKKERKKENCHAPARTLIHK